MIHGSTEHLAWLDDNAPEAIKLTVPVLPITPTGLCVGAVPTLLYPDPLIIARVESGHWSCGAYTPDISDPCQITMCMGASLFVIGSSISIHGVATPSQCWALVIAHRTRKTMPGGACNHCAGYTDANHAFYSEDHIAGSPVEAGGWTYLSSTGAADPISGESKIVVDEWA